MPNEPHLAGMPPELVDASNAAKARALRHALQLGLGGFATSASLAGLLGLLHSRSRQIPSYPLQTEIDLPYPQEVAKTAAIAPVEALGSAITIPASAAIEAYIGKKTAKEPGKGALHGAVRGSLAGLAAAGGTLAGYAGGHKLVGRFPRLRYSPRFLGREILPAILGPVAGSAAYGASRAPAEDIADRLIGVPAQKRADLADSLVGATMSAKPGDPMPALYSPRWARGDTQTSWPAVPWGLPLAAASMTGGALGGHQLVKHILRKRRKADLASQLDAAQKEYDEAMLSQYDPAKLRKLTMPKEASVSESALDFCFAKLADLNELLGGAAGMYGVGALALAGASGLGTYKWLHARSGQKLLRDALKRRATLRALQNPPNMYVRPVPVEYVEDQHAQPAR